MRAAQELTTPTAHGRLDKWELEGMESLTAIIRSKHGRVYTDAYGLASGKEFFLVNIHAPNSDIVGTFEGDEDGFRIVPGPEYILVPSTGMEGAHYSTFEFRKKKG